jgi:2-haloacid dehalogenase
MVRERRFPYEEVTVSARNRWVTFACFGTLVDWEAWFAEAVAPLAADRVPELARAYLEHERLIERDEAMHSYKDVLVTALVRAAGDLRLPISPADAQLLTRTWGSMRVSDQVEAMLAELRQKGWRLAVLTNCDDDLFEVTHRTFRSPFDLFVTSERVRAYKPARWPFRAFEIMTGVARQDWVHVATSGYKDIEPAARLGITYVRLDREGTFNGFASVRTVAGIADAVEAARAGTERRSASSSELVVVS